MFSVLLRFTKFVISLCIAWTLYAPITFADAKIEILRKAVIANGLVPAEEERPLSDLAIVGGRIFESRSLSLNGDISCRQCHLDEFGTTDGIPLAVGVSGEGRGVDRVRSAYRFLARNTLPLWGRGADGFDSFFWDGRVEVLDGDIVSQFGGYAPSSDPLAVAVHLPPVETIEMLEFDEVVERHRQETVEGAMALFERISENLFENEPNIAMALARATEVREHALGFGEVAEGLTAFIREGFHVRESRLHQFAFEGASLTDKEIEGGLIFYGKGRCATCHTGPHFSDLDYHAIAFPQLGQGRNGFGVDYGRFNITHDPSDLYLFRTPPLWDVTDTGPYGHSGSVATLKEAIQAHFDPLALVDSAAMDTLERHELYKRVAAASSDILQFSMLTNDEIGMVVSFLETLDQTGSTDLSKLMEAQPQ